MAALEMAPWADRIVRLEAREATQAEVSLVHLPRYVEAMRRICEKGGEFLPRMEAAVGEASYPAAMRAVGAGLTLADAVMAKEESGKWKEEETPTLTKAESGKRKEEETPPPTPPASSGEKIGFAPTRPPGHHATYDRPMGFCIFNNIAILAKYLQTKHGIGKVAIVDFDVHHGNGTEEAFWKDPTVLYVSLHTADSYPYNSGRREDSGEEAGKGFTLNVPLAPGSGDREYLAAFDRYVMPKLEEFAPEFLLVSAGFDAHFRDPLGALKLTDSGYKELARRLKAIADKYCEGRMISLLEGGYDLKGLGGGVTAYLGELIGQ